MAPGVSTKIALGYKARPRLRVRGIFSDESKPPVLRMTFESKKYWMSFLSLHKYCSLPNICTTYTFADEKAHSELSVVD